MRWTTIGHTDLGRHRAFFHFVDTVFGGGRVDRWSAWRDRGGWTSDYTVFVGEDDAGDIAATIGRSRMRLVIEGEERIGYQLGAVAVAERFRGQGLSRTLMKWVLDGLDTPEQPVILFANEQVTTFYPRFGFQRLQQAYAAVSQRQTPSGVPAPRCDLDDPADRARLEALCAQARPPRGSLTARDYFWVATWNLTSDTAEIAWIPDHDAAIVFTIGNDTLVVQDVLAPAPFDLRPIVPTLIADPVSAVRMQIDPTDFWPSMPRTIEDDSHSPLFARGAAALVRDPVQFPPLART